ncbi:MAG: alanine racemase, partial [Candidatus Wallbacteria bacterium]|nr:alanine racemase [Candidatus Wallbacteria bacterium]
MLQPTRALIHIDRFRRNSLAVRSKVGPGCLICMALKADAYGHGAIALAHEAELSRLADFIGVATVPEGIQIKESGVRLPVI